ncbi:AbrB family transcriptional regulator [Robertmurraya massiliosenegalensis]|uniref:AbrB family transcriptional regulator n=1 Tax=Robertmurraya massiliosenegalensis TaxID=1287657 RepID=UPI0002ED4D67|nr:AbrB family transcriptional regulator [Robertmurraya massiliosenegalensis]
MNVQLKQWTLIITMAFMGGFVGYCTQLSLGVFLGSVLVISLWTIFKKNVPKFPLKIKKIVQIIVGGNIGLAFTTETFDLIKQIWLPGLLVSFINTILGLLLAFILHRYLKYDPCTALASSAPAGMSEMSLIAERYETDIPTVLSIHLFRVIVIILTVPAIVSFVIHLI